ncbi:DoxX family protein [Georgenia sp. TF02-10]|uniref:DoxX family protein n=1 Tax=Georgenia sp. TF02-10 TaxID=2917725 RepID=UPI001FA76BEC|nr:DoxX family protein [Georgenia sp. TF02-10]UNX53911.1 DoxX family protein [Georgenia sp. TF02-10]
MATPTVPRTAPAGRTMYQEEIVTSGAARKVLAIGRIIIGWTFLWAFLDKTFGLGFMTPSEGAWINGGTPAQGFIKGIEGPFHGFFQIFANPFGDWLFQLGLLGIGVAMMLGAGLKIAAVAGTLLLAFMYLAELPLVLGGTNPITDSHWIEAMLLIISAVTLAGDTWGLGKWWAGKVGNNWLR